MENKTSWGVASTTIPPPNVNKNKQMKSDRWMDCKVCYANYTFYYSRLPTNQITLSIDQTV